MSSYVTKKTPGNTEWFRHDRFGMFIHWGVYALAARHEWVKTNEYMTDERYRRYVDHFVGDMYDPRQWAKQAKAAGMKYAIFTTKHHDGFCMFDTQYTDYKCTNSSIGRDIVREYIDAFRAEGLKIGLYYSLIDWHHPEFTIDTRHPRRADPDALEQNAKKDMRIYDEYMRNQVEELLSNYGKIDIIWFDASYTWERYAPNPMLKGKGKDDWEAEKLLAVARRLMPEAIIDNRTDIEQDLWTPEQIQPKFWLKHKETGELVTWEACQTLSGSWGYYRDEQTWKSPRMLLEMLINTVSIGGNLLMNVGPTARGYLDYRAENALKVYADWMKYNSRSIYGCTMAEPELIGLCPNGCKFTQSEDGSRLYIHLFEYPFKFLELPGFGGKVEYAQFLHDGSELLFEVKRTTLSEGRSVGDDLLVIDLPIVKPWVEIPVIELMLK